MDAALPSGTAVTVTTSGSTGVPQVVALGLDAIEAAASASARRLGGTGRWLLAMPTTHIAGMNVVVRSLLAGHDPVTMPQGSFTAEAFLASWRAADGPRARYVSLVPTQLARLVRAATSEGSVDSPDHAGLRACLTALNAVLVGGAAPDPALIAAARGLGMRVVVTYGCAETCGGVVYDGVPLDGTEVRLDPAGRIAITGVSLALGYVETTRSPGEDPHPDAGSRFFTESGRRWFGTSDLGAMLPTGRLAVLGRADDVIVTGGIKVAPLPVEQVLRSHPGVDDAVVVGVPDPEWGQRVAALVVPRHDIDGSAGNSLGASPDEPLWSTGLRELVRARFGRAATPDPVLPVSALPRLASGKVDRAEALRRVMLLATDRSHR
jgi:O-succinylbenzoic acid--CoA ligase